MNRAVVNVACGAHFPRSQKRLVRSLKQHGFKGEVLTWTNKYPPDSPTHNELPYAFKIYAIEEAHRQGFDVVWWLDASMVVQKSLDPLWKMIEEKGYLLFNSGNYIGSWCSDKAIAVIQATGRPYTRDDMMEMIMPSAGITGLNLSHPTGLEYLQHWKFWATYERGAVFKGPWSNKGLRISKDRRCHGHRHDMVAAGIVVHEMKLKMHGPKWFQYAPGNKEAYIKAFGP